MLRESMQGVKRPLGLFGVEQRKPAGGREQNRREGYCGKFAFELARGSGGIEGLGVAWGEVRGDDTQ